MKLRTARLLDKGLLFVITLLLLGEEYSIPSSGFWAREVSGHRYIPFILIVLAAVFGAFAPFEASSRRARTEQRVTLRRQILTTFGQLLDIGRTVRPSLDVSDFALHIWRRQRTIRHPLTGELQRLATYRLGASPVTRSIRPIKGVGVVGLCWLRDEEVGFDVESLAAQVADASQFDAFGAAHGAESVMGFSWSDFQRFKHRGAVFASPIRNGRSKFMGCVSFDAARGYGSLASNRMWHELSSLCVTLGQEGFEYV